MMFVFLLLLRAWLLEFGLDGVLSHRELFLNLKGQYGSGFLHLSVQVSEMRSMTSVAESVAALPPYGIELFCSHPGNLYAGRLPIHAGMSSCVSSTNAHQSIFHSQRDPWTTQSLFRHIMPKRHSSVVFKAS